MNGADRFQLFFDRTTRRTTGVGNVIRAQVKLQGIIPENQFVDLVATHDGIKLLASICPKRNWYSTLYKWKAKNPADANNILRFHKNKNATSTIEELLCDDCSLKAGFTFRIDVVYDVDLFTHVLLSINHTLMDYAGVENLLASISGNMENLILKKPLKGERTFLKKFADAVSATAYVAARTSWNLRRLKKNNQVAKASIVVTQLTSIESTNVKQYLQTEIKTTALPFFVASAVLALHKNNTLLTDIAGDYFIAVPLNRRPASHKNVLLANYLSFVYFHKQDAAIAEIKKLSASFNSQMIEQARKKMPEKFISLMDLFRFLPPVIYWAWMNLPTKGHSATFAFSLLNNSCLENKSFMGFPVLDVIHYPPVISPPGLNIVFTEFQAQLKIIISFDENRITKSQVQNFIAELKTNLLN